MTDATPTDPTESLTDPAALADDPGVDYREATDDSHFELNRDNEGVAVLGVTDEAGELALADVGPVTILPHAVVEPGADFAAVAHHAADELLGIDVTLDDLVRVRRKVSTSEDAEDDAVAYDAVYAASPAGDGVLPDEVTSCQVEETGWFDSLPDALPDDMRDDARLLID
ncbi:hypothetical protein [Halobacterium wangiae]|uniref:hypothetical protein n=1 Tax=Halobacterium wangiae TaxID=2902623 RepID=UPI001E3EF1E4|nr:hypothetical protein [Halobacterium wangiae]